MSSGIKNKSNSSFKDSNRHLFDSNDMTKNNYKAQNFYNPINLRLANGYKEKDNRSRAKTYNPNSLNMMNIEESNEFESINYKPKYT
jgi:hypothetical protein